MKISDKASIKELSKNSIHVLFAYEFIEKCDNSSKCNANKIEIFVEEKRVSFYYDRLYIVVDNILDEHLSYNHSLSLIKLTVSTNTLTTK